MSQLRVRYCNAASSIDKSLTLLSEFLGAIEREESFDKVMSHMAYPLSTLKVAMFLVERLCGKRFLMDGEFLKKLSKRGKKAYVFTRKAALLIKNFANVSLSKAAKMNLKWMDGDVFHGIVFARKWERKQQISRYVLASL